MDRRSWIVSSSLTAVLAAGWIAALSAWIHAVQESVHRADLLHHERLRITDPALAADLPPLTAPRLSTDVVVAVDTSLPLVAAMLLGTALVGAGHRRWGLLAPVLLNLVAAVQFTPLGGQVLTPTDISAPPSSWWPWNEVVLHAALSVLPAAGAVLLVRHRAGGAPVPRVGARTAALRAGVAAAALVLLQVPLSPTGLGAADPVALAQAATQSLVVVASGLVAAGSTRRALGAWTAVVLALLGARVVLRGFLAPDQYGAWSATGLAGALLGLLPVALGPLAVLAAPWLGRQWVRVFRSGGDRTRPSRA